MDDSAKGHTYCDWTANKNGVIHERTCTACGDIDFDYHSWGDWVTEDNRTFWEKWVMDETITHTCTECGASESQLVEASSFLGRFFNAIYLWFANAAHKIVYIFTLDWLFPWITIK